MAVDLNAPLQTKSGERVTLTTRSLRSRFPLGGIRTSAAGAETLDQWTADGFKVNATTPDPLDLENTPQSRGYVNVTPATLFATQAEADAAAPVDRIARLAVKFVNGQLD